MAEEILNEEVVLDETKTEEEKLMASFVHDPNTPIVTVKKLLEAGVHYGHPTKRWNPKMKPYIYIARNGIYIIDLMKTKDAVTTAYEKLKDIVNDGGKVLFVGTKQNAKEIVQDEAVRSGSFFVNNRWLGGILTNFKTIQLRIRKLKEMEAQEENGEWDSLPKKVASKLRKEKDKLYKNLEGIKEMRKVPNALVVVDPMMEHNAVREANKLNIPVFALCDTNCDPDNIDYVIPANDDADKAVKLIISLLADAVVEAKGGLPDVAFAPDSDNDVNMKDVLRQVDRENALRLAAKREMAREKLEREKTRRFAYENRKDEVATSKATMEAEDKNIVEEKVETNIEVASVVEKPTKKVTKKAFAKKEEPVVEQELDDVDDTEVIEESDRITITGTKVYHVNKRASDSKWTIKFAYGKKVIKTFDTKEEAMKYANTLADNQGGVVLFHASKGAHKGKIILQGWDAYNAKKKEAAEASDGEDGDDTEVVAESDKTTILGTKVYHVNKRATDNKWTIKFARGSKVIKLFDTKEEAMEYANELADNQDGIVLFHASKGEHKGKIIRQGWDAYNAKKKEEAIEEKPAKKTTKKTTAEKVEEKATAKKSTSKKSAEEKVEEKEKKATTKKATTKKKEAVEDEIKEEKKTKTTKKTTAEKVEEKKTTTKKTSSKKKETSEKVEEKTTAKKTTKKSTKKDSE